MGTAHKLSIAVTDELAGDIYAAVASGDYASASEVIRDALRGWKRERADRGAAIRRLRELWDEGLASGEPIAGGFDARDIVGRGRARHAASRTSGG